MQEIDNSPIAAVASRFIQDCHADRYLGSKRVTILGEQPRTPHSNLLPEILGYRIELQRLNANSGS